MNTLTRFQRRLGWINLPGAFLMMLLQRLPAVSVAVATEEMVIASPVGALLKSAVAVVGALGTVNTLVGATPLVPSAGTVGGITVNAGSVVSVFYTVNGTQTPPMSWHVTGNIPPGLNFSGLTSPGSVNVGSLHLQGTPTAGGAYSVTLQTFEFTNEGGEGSPVYSYTITVNGAANTAPSITTQPSSQTVTAGQSVTFSAAADGTPAPTFQWRKNGNNIGGANNSSYSIGSVSAGDAGDYTVVATNSQGNATSNVATLTVSAALSAPSFTTQPNSQSVTAGSGVTFTASANGNPTPTYQWRKNGNNIGGATDSSYSIGSVSAGDAGDYTVVATNSQGTATSNAATLIVGAALSAPSFTLQPVGQMITAGSPVTFTAAATGNPAPAYQWYKGAVAIGGATSNTFSLASATVADAGAYAVIATNSQGSATSNTATLIVSAVSLDFNRDGKSDLLWQNRLTGERYVWMMNGTSVASTSYIASLPTEWSIAATGDFNADGKTDLVWQNTVTGDRYVYLMDGVNVLAGASLGNVSPVWSIVAAADFNGDGQTDLVWQNTANGDRYVYFMNGTTFLSGTSLGNVPLAWTIAGAADFNADGHPDLLWQNTATGEEYVWLMNGTTYVSGVSLGTDYYLQLSGTGDYNGDGKPDILLTNMVTGERFVRLMNGTSVINTVSLGTLGLEWILNRPGQRRVPADFNVDGRSDLVWQNFTTGERYIYLMNGTSLTSGESLELGVSSQWTVVTTADFNADGKPDVVGENLTTGERVIWLMNGNTVSSTVSLGIMPLNWTIAAAADMNQDGKPDLVWQDTNTGSRYLWLMNGTAFSSGQTLTLPASAQWRIAATADFDGDGKADLVGENMTTGERAVWIMNNGVVTSTSSLGTVAGPWVIANTIDLDADGHPDVIWQNTTTGERYIYLMNGTTFVSAVFLTTIPTNWSICR